MISALGADLRLVTRSADDTRALGAALAGGLRAGDVVLLAGDLGAGKTTLAQGIAAGLGATGPVTSPTFTLVRSHPCRAPGAEGVRTLLHADLYRLDRLAEVVDLGLGELVEDGAVAVVEWGDVAGPSLGPDTLVVALAPGPGADDRSLELTASGAVRLRLTELAGRLEAWSSP